MQVFLYGPLRHRPLLEAVLGTTPGTGREARIHGVILEGAGGPDLAPAVRRSEEGTLDGEIVDLPGDEALARLDWYEGLFGRRREPVVPVGETDAALAWLPEEDEASSGAAWDFAAWRDRMGRAVTAAATEALRRRENGAGGSVGPLMSFITARAWARELATPPAPQRLRSPAGSGSARILRDRAAYDGFFRLDAFDIEHECFDGSMSGPVSRETFISYDVAMVLPYDPRRDRVLLIEQLRYGPLHRGDPAHRVLEPVAGLVDAGETPVDCARREAVEEAHLKLGDLTPMLEAYNSPGYSTEFMHCFLGLCDLEDADGRLGGHPDENEDIRSHVVSFDEAMALIDSGEINVAPLAMMLLWLSRHRERLRAAA